MAAKRPVRVASYNVLSNWLCSGEGSYGFARCRLSDLDSNVRLERVRGKLAAQMSRGAIVALQEVSRDWCGELVPFFEAAGYAHVSVLSGGAKGGHMGQVVAWPREDYALREVDMPRIGGTVQSGGGTSAWEDAVGRHNCAAMVRLEQRSNDDSSRSSFCVANYHMPCAFGSDERCQVVVAHAAMLLQHAQRWAGGKPLVVLGDFNFDPSSAAYSLVANGTLDATHPQRPQPNKSVGWDLAVEPMRSAYVTAWGREPEFTNFAHTGEVGNVGGSTSLPFCETLDYIWLSEEWSVRDVESLPSKESLTAQSLLSYPTEDEPSDHLLLAASLTL